MKILRNNSVVHTKFLCGFALAMLFLQTKILFSQEYDYSDSLLDEDIFVNENVPILTPPPLLHERTSTEFTILGKKLTSKFKMTDYHPGQQSEPLRYAVKTILTIINKEISVDKYNFSDVYKIKNPDFKLTKANKIPFIAGDHSVGDVISAQHSRQTLILTTWRSGSTFLGDLLNQYPGSFYFFEPLHYYSNVDEAYMSQTEESFLESLFKCKFDLKNFGYLQHVAHWANTFLFKNHNFRLWNSCHSVLPLSSMCFLPEFLSFACKLHPIKLIKTVRMRMRKVEKLLSDPMMNLKIILLVRDPRGVFNSRGSALVSNWCTDVDCASPTNECKDLLDDLENAQRLHDQYPGRIHLVRFEDISLDPENIVRKILAFLDLPWIERMEEYIATHTVQDNLKIDKETKNVDPYSTSRNSSAVAFAWRKSLAMSNISAIQSVCKEPMNHLGYKLINSADDLNSLPLEKTAREVWPMAFRN